MTREWNGEAPEVSDGARPPALLDVAGEIAAGVHELVPSCSCAVVVQLGVGWQVVGQSGRDDVAGGRHEAIAEAIAHGKAQRHGGLVETFGSHALVSRLVLAADGDEPIPEVAREAVQAVLQQGGALLDRALAAQQRDRAIRPSPSRRRTATGSRPRRPSTACARPWHRSGRTRRWRTTAATR